MKNVILDKVKQKKIFEFNDIFVYLFILIAIALLIIFFTIIPQRNHPKGFKVLVDNEEFLTFYYQSQEFTYSENLRNFIEIDKDNGQVVIFHNLEKTNYNVIKYNVKKLSIYYFLCFIYSIIISCIAKIKHINTTPSQVSIYYSLFIYSII